MSSRTNTRTTSVSYGKDKEKVTKLPSPEDELASMKEVREIVGHPKERTSKKILNELDETSMEFIRRSPFLVLATADDRGFPDVSPKGDHPGFVHVLDRQTLLIPERRGNKLAFGLQNILLNPRVAVIFLLPGTGETLRVTGTAGISSNKAVLESLADSRGKPAVLAIRVAIDHCYFHCAKAILRSSLWDSDYTADPLPISFGKIIAQQIAMESKGNEQIDMSEIALRIDEDVEEGYRSRL